MGVPYPIRKHAQGFLHVQDGVEQIKSDLLILLLTNPGERCLTGDTKIPLANGTEKTIKELVGLADFWVYSYDKESNSILAGKAKAFETLKNAELLMVTLDNHETVRCTPDHSWLLRDGTYKQAQELQEGDSLMPLYRNLNTSKYDKRNNDPNNLEWMTCVTHKELHKLRPEVKNHKVLKVEKLDYREDCYDLSVEKYHNFALSAGVFVHNCFLPTFGTPLRRLVFEPNDAGLEFKAKQMIATAIKQWEPRVAIQQIDVKNKIDEADLDINDDLSEIEHILSIKILFVDPENIQEVQELKLEIPLSGS